MTVQEIIKGVIAKTGLEPLPQDKTCDRLICGSMEQEVTGIVTTFMATVDVIRKAKEIGANLIITHEPTWFTGLDCLDWLGGDSVYQKKKTMIEESGMVIWRFHDHMHMGRKDEIYTGFEKEFGWENYRVEIKDTEKYGETDPMQAAFWKNFGAVYQIPATTLRGLGRFFKEKTGMEVVQIVGNPDMSVERVSVLAGGGSLGLGREEAPMIQMEKEKVDVVICGDITEWTLPAYVRDAAMLGLNKGMLVLGHERSEEWGMKHLKEWLSTVASDTPVTFVDAKEPFVYL